MLTFFRAEQRRPIVVTTAKTQPFPKKHNITICYYYRLRVCPSKLQKIDHYILTKTISV